MGMGSMSKAHEAEGLMRPHGLLTQRPLLSGGNNCCSIVKSN